MKTSTRILVWIKQHKVWSSVIGLIVLSWILGTFDINVMVVGRLLGLIGGLILVGWLLEKKSKKK